MSYTYPAGAVLYRKFHRSFPLISHGQGSYLFDSQGKKYLDACGGAAVVNVGHGVKKIADAMAAQAGEIAYVNGTQFTHRPVEELAERVAGFMPFKHAKVFFLTSGSEAVEAAVKLAWQYWKAKGAHKKYHIISRKPSYHGNTLAALSISERRHYQNIIGPMLMANHKIPAPYCYRCAWDQDYPACGLECAHALEEMISKLGRDNVAAFVTEIIGGSSLGAAVPPEEYFQIVRSVCDQNDVLLIADEILSGVGRTGEWIACQHMKLTPDVVVLGKGLTGGYFPLSALAAREELVDVICAGGRDFIHAQTFAHHPVGCAAGLATLDFIEKNKLIARCVENGNMLFKELVSLLSRPHVGDIRGKGSLLGVEFVADKKSGAPFSRDLKYIEQFLSLSLEKGIIFWPNTGHADGENGDLILIAPPYIITSDEITRIVETLGEILLEMEKMF